ncbi:MAG: hypothetical protein WCC80_17270, partial [Pseudolabrys sp.]
MRRRDFISLLGGAAAWPLAAHAQQVERMRRIGVLMGLRSVRPLCCSGVLVATKRIFALVTASQ